MGATAGPVVHPQHVVKTARGLWMEPPSATSAGTFRRIAAGIPVPVIRYL